MTASPYTIQAIDPLEKKQTAPLHPDPEGAQREDALAFLAKIKSTDDAHPMHWVWYKKWFIVVVYCLQIFVTLTSTTYVSVEFIIMEKWTSSQQVATLGQSLLIVGTVVGPVFLGSLSDIGGRKWVYVGSIFLYAILNIGTALADNLPMLIIFCFLIGVAGSSALSNVAGTIADLFGDADNAAQPMALFVLIANFDPSLGSPIGEWIAENESLSWRWIFYINIIIGGVFFVLLCFMPETLPRIVISNPVKSRGNVDRNTIDIAMGSSKISVLDELEFVATVALRIMFVEPIVISLGLYNEFAYGLLFLFLDGVFDVFVVNNGLSYIGASLTYLNFCVGVTATFLFVPVQTYLFKRDRLKHGHLRPEARFLTSLLTNTAPAGSTSYWSPIVSGGVLGFCDPLVWLAMLNYITNSYPNVAASAIAAFLIPSFLIAAGCAHAGVAMFTNINEKWAFVTLGFISIGLVVLVYVLFILGPNLRKWSKLADPFEGEYFENKNRVEVGDMQL
ncbi:uncharacterized protein A1O9_05054 [Exophiala aquamarina CBS 119918]|uniref:Major facilitator superfamily (MFS) profile domain-containing protein n=1 Tax=Exophiala aquamarina CBS 119918 TaxID=1182545 RepID=A0A072PJB6_9EURO|nr:uncharacterized protein A1O9_05054 [Exophiala aquamarina CBS 119918]KEF60204.1 hypothetical protein A1O9_05054 [Exophiala aquamarina CBS 119918]